MRRFQVHGRSDTRFKGLFPACHAKAPPVARGETREMRLRRNQIIAKCTRKFQELFGHARTNSVQPDIAWARTAITVPVEASDRMFATAAQFCAKHVCRHILLTSPFSRQHKLISFRVDAHRQMRRLIPFRLRFSTQPTASGDHFPRPDYHIRHLKSQPRPGPLSFSATVDADRRSAHDHLAHYFRLLCHIPSQDIAVKLHRTLQVRRPDDILHSLYFHLLMLIRMVAPRKPFFRPGKSPIRSPHADQSPLLPLGTDTDTGTSYYEVAASAPEACSFPGIAPVMMATTSPIECSWGVVRATRRPSRMMWIRSASSKTCGIL
jgi:hypothetical protein